MALVRGEQSYKGQMDLDLLKDDFQDIVPVEWSFVLGKELPSKPFIM